MATFEAQPIESKLRETQGPPVPSASEDAMALDHDINGAARQQNDIPAFPTPPTDSDYPKENGVATQMAQKEQAVAPALQVDPSSDITSTASVAANEPSPSSMNSTLPSVASATNEHAPIEQPISAPDVTSTPSLAASEQITSTAPTVDDTTTPTKPSFMGNVESFQPQDSILQVPDAKPEGTEPSLSSTKFEPEPLASDPTQDMKQDGPGADSDMPDAPQQAKIAREREDDDAEEPMSKRPKTESNNVSEQTSPIAPTVETPIAAPPAVGTAEPPATPAVVAAPLAAPTRTIVSSQPASAEEWGTMTDFQERQLKQNMQNLKKGRHATHFSKPVDPVALNIPTYLDIVKIPMDLSTMDKKLREHQYPSVADFIDDFNRIVDNTLTFNGSQHIVSLAGVNLRAQFEAGLKRVPKAGEAGTPAEKKRRSSLGPMPLPQRDVKPRESRPSLGAPATPVTPNGTNQTFALGQNGIPLTRRTSAGNDGRPKREIHRPPPRDLPYLSAKPKKKKYAVELKFCEHVLGELKKGRYAHLMAPFRAPVDPVALNIPNYLKVIKKPMDFGTITDKLNAAHYENAKEFENDVNLVFENCFKFNGPAHPVSGLAKQLQDHFHQELSQKNNWLAINAPSSAPQSPEVELESEVEEEDDEEDEVLNDDRDKQIQSIHEQIAELSRKAMALSSAPSIKKPVKDKKKGKTAKGAPGKEKRKSLGSVPRADKKTSKPKMAKAPKILTVKEKEEISERIGELSGEETAKAAELIKAGLRKNGRHDLADRPDEELEFDIDSIPNDVLYQLLMLVRRVDPTPDYRPLSQVSQVKSTSSKHKKSKPMSKHEQEAAVRRLQGQMSQFESTGGYGGTSSSPDPNAVASDDDDDDSGSESEEE